jgi:glycosyltransferase involved in cell wall biosynthesis
MTSDESLRLLFLSEGNPESAASSGSGTPYSVIAHLRSAGAHVSSADVDLRGASKGLAAALTFDRRREAWVARYHIGSLALKLRSRNARAAVRRSRDVIDAVLQYGGTFGIGSTDQVPYFLYCDNNIRNSMAQPRSWAAQLGAHEIEAATAWEETLYRNAAAIFTFSTYAKRSFVDRYGVPDENVVVVGSGPNLPLNSVPVIRTADLRSTAPTILFVGRDFENKGGPVLLDAFTRVRQRFPDARLRIVGPSTFAHERPGVEFLGYLNKDSPDGFARLLRAYAEADVFCLPTRYESFGIAFVEAMWFGLPVIAPRHWAIPEIVDDRTTGFLVETEDPDNYASHILQLFEDPCRALEMGRRGRARAEARFNWERVAAVMSDVISARLARIGS